jgi:hypothetical protein
MKGRGSVSSVSGAIAYLLTPSVGSTLILIGLGALLVPLDQRTPAGRLGRKLLVLLGLLLMGVVMVMLVTSGEE